MNAVEIEEAISVLAEQPFLADEFPFAFLEAFGNKQTTIKRLRSGASNKSDLDGVLQTNNIHIKTCPPGGVTATLAQLKASSATTKGKAKFILATDGDLNVGITDDNSLVKLIKQKASEGVFLTVLGFGTGNLKDAKMEKLADNGNGNYAYIDSSREAHKVLVNQMSGNLVTIAKDVKLQLEFNPKHVGAYRLIGYENRTLANADFTNDKKDAGEIGAGHTVTALYELVSAESLNKQSEDGDSQQERRPLKYQQTVAGEPDKEMKLSEEGESDELLTLLLRHKNPDASTSVKSEEYVCKNADVKFAEASADFRFAAGVASFGMLLRGSRHAGAATLNSVREIASGAVGDDVDGNRSEMIDLVRRSIELKQ